VPSRPSVGNWKYALTRLLSSGYVWLPGWRHLAVCPRSVGDLTDDDLDRLGGEWDKLIGRLQERYGYTRERAADEVDQRFREYEHTAR
jgi:hypothetical protein